MSNITVPTDDALSIENAGKPLESRGIVRDPTGSWWRSNCTRSTGRPIACSRGADASEWQKTAVGAAELCESAAAPENGTIGSWEPETEGDRSGKLMHHCRSI